jgi:uncharacterized protein YfbU (UPF0304 family)
MKTKAQIMDDIHHLINSIQQNRQSLLQPIFSHSYNREILTIKNDFYTIVDNLTSEFTEQELYTIKTDLLSFYPILKELIDSINDQFQTQNPPRVIDTLLNALPPYDASLNPYHTVTFSEVESSIIKQEDIDQFAIHIERRIEGIIKEIEKNQEMQLRQVTQIYDCYKGLADNLFQEMMEMDEQLYVMQTQRHDAAIKNLIAVLDGV